MRILILMICVLSILSGCATPIPFQGFDYSADPEFITHPDNIIITTDDITDRPYKVIKDISATAGKFGLFDEDPTSAHVDARLKHQASILGADAVILVRYGAVGIGLASWGQMDGKGRAVKFVK